MDVTATLARFVAKTRYDDIPERVRHEARRALLNVLGCAIGSGGHETVERAMRALSPFFGGPHATLIGRKERADVLHAALINGIAAHVMDFDDTHPNTIHPSAPVWPAVLALGERRHLDGRSLLHAFILGAEVGLRVGNAIYPAHYERGYHATATCGVFGAAAAGACLLKLDGERTSYALSMAATQASGLREMFGSDCKSLHPGKAARDGLTAALLASNGFTSSSRGIEAPRGFANVLSSAHNFGAISKGLGSEWEIGLNMYKPFACGLVVHAAIDGCIELRNAHGLRASSVEQLSVRVSPMVMELTAKTEPRTGLEGKFSIYHACAIAIIRGRAGEAEFGDAAVRDPEVITLRRKVDAQPDASIGMMEAYVTIRLSDGRTLEHNVKSALGSVERPMSDRDLEAKFYALVENILPKPRADELVDACWCADACEDVGTIARLCAAD